MKPTRSILDQGFVYIPAAATQVEQTWRRHGWKPKAEQEQKAQPRVLVCLTSKPRTQPTEFEQETIGRWITLDRGVQT